MIFVVVTGLELSNPEPGTNVLFPTCKCDALETELPGHFISFRVAYIHRGIPEQKNNFVPIFKK